MKIKSVHFRRLFLAGTVEFPTPYPTVGTISIETHTVQYPPDDREEEQVFVVVQELPHHTEAVTRIIPKDSVAAIVFVAGSGKKGSKEQKEHACCPTRFDPETGIWFLKPDIELKRIAERLKIPEGELAGRNSPAQGIVFVPEAAAVLSICESFQIAAEAAESSPPRTKYCECGCSCCNFT